MSNPIKSRAPDPVDIAIGAAIRKRRHALGMSQEGLGVLIDLTFQQVQKYERGSNRISGSKLYAIAGALGCHPGHLFPDAGNMVLEGQPVDFLSDVRRVNDLNARLIGKLARLDRRTVNQLDAIVSAILDGPAVTVAANSDPCVDADAISTACNPADMEAA